MILPKNHYSLIFNTYPTHNYFTTQTVSSDARPHTHDFFELLYVKNGIISHSVNCMESCTLKKGDFMFINIGTMHEYTGASKEIIDVMFTGQVIDNALFSCTSINDLLKSSNISMDGYLPSFPSEIILHDNDSSIYNLIQILTHEYENPTPSSGAIIHHCMISLILRALELESTTTSNTISEVSRMLLNIIQERYSEPNLLTTASNTFNYSIPHLSAVFKKDFGISFKDYLQKHRVEIAQQLLKNTDLNIAQVSNSVGYDDAKFFTKIFKKYTNLSPMQYKKNIKNSLSMPIARDIR